MLRSNRNAVTSAKLLVCGVCGFGPRNSFFFLNYFKFEGKSWTSDAMGNGFLFIEETHFSEICLSVDFDWTGPAHLEKCFSENPPFSFFHRRFVLRGCLYTFLFPSFSGWNGSGGESSHRNPRNFSVSSFNLFRNFYVRWRQRVCYFSVKYPLSNLSTHFLDLSTGQHERRLLKLSNS